MDDQVYELTLSALAYGGDAIGRLPALRAGGPQRVVFVPFAVPGERVRIRIVEQRRAFARAELLEVLEPSPQRIAPRCKHFGVCGGCHYQHMPYELQLQAKADILRDQFRRIGHIEDAPIQPTVASPSPWNYRNQVQFHLNTEGRLSYVAALAPLPSSSPGTSTPQSKDLLVPITECHLPETAINDLWPQLEFDPELELDRVTIRGGAEEELLLVLEAASPDLPEIELDSGISIAHICDDHTVILAGRDHITLQVLGRDFRVSASSFFQVNTPMAERMVQHILSLLALSQPPGASPQSQSNYSESEIVDVYCGAGLFSAFLAPHCRRLIGIEASPAACDDFVVNLDEFDNVELYQDTAENALPALDIQPKVMLVDPPRAGLAPAALEAVLRLQPPSLIYVSCDPSTLGRDAARLIAGGYRLAAVTPFDLFPQTYHIESISHFTR